MYENPSYLSQKYTDFLSARGLTTLRNLKSHLLLKYSDAELQNVLLGRGQGIPVCAFAKDLSLLESVVKFLHENRKMGFAEIARSLNRAQSTISTTYRKAAGKKQSRLAEDGLHIPCAAFSDRRLSVFESVVLYLKERGCSISQIAGQLKRDSRVVWEIARRAQKKAPGYAAPKPGQDEQLLLFVRDTLQGQGFDFIKLFNGIRAEASVPVSVFSSNVPPLSALVGYLRERGLSVSEIASRLKRTRPLVSQSYRHHVFAREFSHSVPLAKFALRKHSVMECVVAHLLSEGLRITEIARLLRRHPGVISKFKRRYEDK